MTPTSATGPTAGAALSVAMVLLGAALIGVGAGLISPRSVIPAMLVGLGLWSIAAGLRARRSSPEDSSVYATWGVVLVITGAFSWLALSGRAGWLTAAGVVVLLVGLVFYLASSG